MLRYIERACDAGCFERPDGMSDVLYRLLLRRGICSRAEADAFLNPSLDQLNDPMLLNDMAEAVRTVRSAIENGDPICIYGDYDVDGVCASAILYTYLESAGAQAEVYLPSRHNEGYGLNEAAVREIAQRAKLLVTVDCGISSCDLIELAKSLGMACVVTDHHRPGEILPDCPVVNPLLNDYPCPFLCGAGVAFKLVHALGGRDAAMELIDLAAIATVADVVPLVKENRAIVHFGLQRINVRPRPGVQALMEAARLEKGSITSETIGFRIAPRLNAGGRLGSARRSYELLVQKDEFSALAQADELEQENARRQSVEREIRAEAERQLQGFDFIRHRIIIVHGKNWNPGVIGLAASHLREEYSYPVIVFSENGDGFMTGSCRSIEGVDIYQTLASAAHLIEKFGGHRQAAGLTIRSENLPALQDALDNYLSENIPQEAYLPYAEYDICASLDDFSETTVRLLRALEPTGCGNPEPIFRASVQLVEARAIGAQGAHLRLICGENGVRRTGIYFGAGAKAASLGEQAEILFTPQLNTWNGRTDVQLRLSALRDEDLLSQIEAARPAESANQRNFLTQLLYNKEHDSAADLSAAGTHARPAEFSDVQALLSRRAQGTILLCADLDTARGLIECIAPCRVDLAIGRLPEDARLFNTIACCPEDLSAWPAALRTLVLAGVPAPQGLPENIEILDLGVTSPLWAEMPDIGQMRTVYKAALYLSRRPVRMRDAAALDEYIAAETGLSPACCRASLLVLRDMKLVNWADQPFRLQLPPMQKTDPETSALWRSIQSVKASFGRRNSYVR